MKRRLVGALVIVLLAIILVPAWLDGSARRLRDEDAFVVPLPPPDNRKAMVEPETIGEQLETEIPKLEPLPDPAPIAETAKQAAEEKAAEAAEAAAAAAQLAKDKANDAANAAKAAVAEVMPAPVELDLNAKTAGESATAASSATGAIKVEVADGATATEVATPRANWIVQVGSFASKENAESMVSRLQKGELKAFMRDFQSNGDSIYRVLVGPFVRQTEADDAKRTIDRRFQVKSFVANWRD